RRFYTNVLYRMCTKKQSMCPVMDLAEGFSPACPEVRDPMSEESKQSGRMRPTAIRLHALFKEEWMLFITS
ncbi:hypothetical protein, partial [Brevibacillus agri]|uniref:hypothetical protein n=1 Tax=Brevibacillus agri TaxID=51101 RepID=UPI003D203DED